MDGESYVQERQRALDGRSPAAAAAGPSIVDKVCVRPRTPTLTHTYAASRQIIVLHGILECVRIDCAALRGPTCSTATQHCEGDPTTSSCYVLRPDVPCLKDIIK